MKRRTLMIFLSIILLLSFLLLSFMLTSCAGGGGSSSGPTPAPTFSGTAEWVMLVYLCGDNDLEYFSYLDMKEMEAVGSTNQVRVIVQWDKMGLDPSANWQGCRRYFVMRDENQQREIVSILLEDMGIINSGNPDTLVDFVKWGIQNFPARKYAVILWDHGSGWRKQPRHGAVKGICWDYRSGDHISQDELRQAFERIRSETGVTIELIGMDACLMGMMEVAYDLRNHGRYMAFSVASESAYGWPYDTILRDLTSNYTMDGSGLARSIVQRYGEYYSGDPSQTQSAINLSKMDALAWAVHSFSVDALTKMDTEGSTMKSCGENAQMVDSGYSDYRDLGDFARRVNSSVSDAALRTEAQAIQTAVTEAVIANHYGSNFPNCTGMTIWIPNSSQYSNYSGRYSMLNMATNTQWDEYLGQVIQR